jgi:hypothetical protein
MHSLKQRLSSTPRLLALLIGWMSCLGAAPVLAQAPVSPRPQAPAALPAPETGSPLCPVDPSIHSDPPPSEGAWPCFGFQVKWTVSTPAQSVVVTVTSGTSDPQTQTLRPGEHWGVKGLGMPMQMDVVQRKDAKGRPFAVLVVSVQLSPSSFLSRDIARWSPPPSTCGCAHRAQH